jgi:excinuclease ABC subunit A
VSNKNKIDCLEIIGASENNLKEVSLDIPHDSFTVITGLSGSGKSSLAFDTVYAEGQRRYIETFSPYTRQFLDKLKKPEVTQLKNVRPAIAIQQKNRITGSRSTVGSLTNINDYLKVIWSTASTPYCPVENIPLVFLNEDTIFEAIKSELIENKNFDYGLVIAEYPINPKFIEGEVDRLKTLGFSRYWLDSSNSIGQLEEIDLKELKKNKSIKVVVDRIKASSSSTKSTKRSIESALNLTNGSVLSYLVSEKEIKKTEYKKGFYSRKTGVTYEKPKSYYFSYNHPMGACPTCKGFGAILEVAKDKIVPDISKTLEEHAISCWSGPSAEWEFNSLLKLCKENKISTNIPFSKLSSKQVDLIFNHKTKDYWGVNHWFKWLETKTYKMHVRVFLSRYREQITCSDCKGKRVRPQSLLYKINGKSIDDVFCATIEDNLNWFLDLDQNLKTKNKNLYDSIKDSIKNVISRLDYLNELGLPYLTLDRAAKTLSGGETQRVNLTTALGSDLVSTQFVLDEPSAGLHPEDSQKLLASIKKLSQKGNSVLVVEHDPDVILNADNIIEVGPKTGKDGGTIVYNGTASKWHGIKIPGRQRGQHSLDKNKFVSIENISFRNLKNISIKFPVNCFVSITGMSGSGKSTLTKEAILGAWDQINGRKEPTGHIGKVINLEAFDELQIIDQSALSKTPRATIGTYTKIWDAVRDLFAQTPTANSLGFTKSHFSFNVNGGRCPDCEGGGYIKEDMQFLSDVLVPCDTCGGSRFQPIIEKIKVNNKSVVDMLAMTIDEAEEFLSNNIPAVSETISVLKKLGLGSLTLGHPLSELSGGEAQRLKLVPHLSDKSRKSSLIIFDEPTTGLHVNDIENLISVFDELIQQGNTVLCIEHNLSVIQNSDWIIDLGPKGGNKGGLLIFCGSYKDFINCKDSFTAQHLKEYLKNVNSTIKSKNKTSSINHKTSKDLIIAGAKEHNLKNISVTIPADKLIAITGVSGSGKSTLAKDIIFSEGQRRYLDCLSPYARQFIKELSKAHVDKIENVRPTICVYQHTFQPSELSTVATLTEVYNFLRLLIAKVGDQYCPEHPEQLISSLSAKDICKNILAKKNLVLRILAPVIRLKKGVHREVFQRAINQEITEVRVDGVTAKPSYFIDEPPAKTKPHTIEFIVAKFNTSTINESILLETVESSLALGEGSIILLDEKNIELVFSSSRACPICQRGFVKPDPEDLSFNSKRGKCLNCEGTGLKKDKICPECLGSRLSEIGRNLKVNNKTIYELCLFTSKELLKFLEDITPIFSKSEYKSKVSLPVLEEIKSRLKTINDLGLDYIQLSRSCRTLSGGELQRIRLASAMNTGLSGAMFIFDEPSAGLHPDDNLKVLKKLNTLKELKNTVLVIEHDVDSILATDEIIDIGPHAGINGGQLVYAGPTKEYLNKNTPTSTAISGTVEIFSKERNFSFKEKLSIKKGNYNFIKNLNIDIPLRSFVTVSGVSGAGKSSLVDGIILPFAKETVDKIINIDQKPIGSTSRSTPASYLGIWDEIRKVFASTLEAKTQGWSASHFSYNSGNGRCQECKGAGVITVEMNFLADAKMLCESCSGSRYLEETLSVKYNNLNISEVLQLTFEEAKNIFSNHRKIHPILNTVCELGLGYLKLGQSSPTLSGGEAQRLKIASELSSAMRGHTLYILDEPTLGLHRADIKKLITSLNALVNKGASVIVIEHDIDIIANCDYMIEMGPKAGSEGGKVIFEGTPIECLNSKSKSRWSEILKNNLQQESIVCNY